HSDQIEVLMDLGIIGYFPFFCFWCLVVAIGLQLLSKPPGPVRQLALAYFGSVGYALGDTFMHGGFLAAGGGVSAYAWSMIAAMLALSQVPELRPMARPRPTASPVAATTESADTEPSADRLVFRLPSARRIAGAT